MNNEIDKSEFGNWMMALKTKIQAARNKIAFSVNSQILELYWDLGREIAEKQLKSGWGSGFIEQIAILQWYKFYSEKYEFVPHGVAQIPWGHNRFRLLRTFRSSTKCS